MEFSEIINFFNPAGNLFGNSLDDKVMIWTAMFGADKDPVDTSWQVEKYGLGGAAPRKAAMPLGEEAYAAVRAPGLGDAVHFRFPGKETVQLVMTSPESVDENPAAKGADPRVKTDRWFGVQPDMFGHEAVAIFAVELFNDKKILSLFLDVLDAFRQGSEKFYRHLFIDKIHSFLLGSAGKHGNMQ